MAKALHIHDKYLQLNIVVHKGKHTTTECYEFWDKFSQNVLKITHNIENMIVVSDRKIIV